MGLFRRSGPSRETLALKVVMLEQQLAAAEQRETYWRERAELYIDRAAAQQGISHEPVMTGREKSVQDALAHVSALAGAGIMEINSSKP